MGVSKQQIYRIDEDFHDKTVPTFRREADDGVINVRINDFLKQAGITRKDVERVTMRFADRLKRAFPTSDSYTLALNAAFTDYAMMLYEINSELGYGKKRLLKVIEFIENYKNDEKEEVFEKLNILYPDPDTLPDTTNLFARPKKYDLTREQIIQKQRELSAVRVIQGV